MAISTVDEKWRIVIPKEVRKAVRMHPRTVVDIRTRRNAIVITTLHKGAAQNRNDSLTWLVDHPIRVNRMKLKKIDLEKVEEEMWLP